MSWCVISAPLSFSRAASVSGCHFNGIHQNKGIRNAPVVSLSPASPSAVSPPLASHQRSASGLSPPIIEGSPAADPPPKAVYGGKRNKSKLSVVQFLHPSSWAMAPNKQTDRPALRFILLPIVARWARWRCPVTVSSPPFASFQLLAVFGGRPAVRLRRTRSCRRSGTSSENSQKSFVRMSVKQRCRDWLALCLQPAWKN